MKKFYFVCKNFSFWNFEKKNFSGANFFQFFFLISDNQNNLLLNKSDIRKYIFPAIHNDCNKKSEHEGQRNTTVKLAVQGIDVFQDCSASLDFFDFFFQGFMGQITASRNIKKIVKKKTFFFDFWKFRKTCFFFIFLTFIFFHKSSRFHFEILISSRNLLKTEKKFFKVIGIKLKLLEFQKISVKKFFFRFLELFLNFLKCSNLQKKLKLPKKKVFFFFYLFLVLETLTFSRTFSKYFQTLLEFFSQFLKITENSRNFRTKLKVSGPKSYRN